MEREIDLGVVEIIVLLGEKKEIVLEKLPLSGWVKRTYTPNFIPPRKVIMPIYFKEVEQTLRKAKEEGMIMKFYGSDC